ncbi:MAG TPA: SDR family oxidoreductase [Planctomycetaceae bacterium]|nr:SDR family oxidoreductase [Planctomycetaceae bacterium]
MGYLFLTGATGLLGSYLVRDLVRAGVELAVLVRSTRFETARQRIEGLVARWERQAGHALPRPVVIEGDLTRPGLDLSDEWRGWAAANCHAVLHNAASLTFHADGPDDEPWRSNLHGTRHVLDFCEAAGIRQFHHVSTAYVCGQRDDLVREDELEAGQRHGNDYEVSKFEAEKLVRGAGFLDSLTVYRPAIILGDSRTGYTSTFHGFYVPLKLVAGLIDKIAGLRPDDETLKTWVKARSQELWSLLGLKGNEQKNYVPVDWVSAVMAHVYSHPELHAATYHLTPVRRVPLAMTQRVLEDVFYRYTEQIDPASVRTENFDWESFLQQYFEGMNVYRSYWGDDPRFDSTNTQRAAPHLPCPELDEAAIEMMCTFALEANFGWPRPPVQKPEFDVEEHLRDLTGSPAGNGQPAAVLGLYVSGRGGGQWDLDYDGGRVTAARPGVSRRATATFYLNSTTFERLARRQASVPQAINTGRVVIEGNGVPPDELARALQFVTCRQKPNWTEEGAPPGPPDS